MAQVDDFDSDDSFSVSESIDSPVFSPISPVQVSSPVDVSSDVASPVSEDQTSAMDTDVSFNRTSNLSEHELFG